MKRRHKAFHRTRGRRFAVPINRCVRGMPVKGNMAPWFLKHALSRPEYKRRRLAEVA